MTARDVIAEMRAMRLAADPEMLRVWADRLESTLAQPSGEAVAWLVRDKSGEAWACDFGTATIWEQTARDFAAWANEYKPESAPFTVHPLYPTTPPAPLGGLTEGERFLAQQLRMASEAGMRITLQPADAGRVCAALRRLTAPQAEAGELKPAPPHNLPTWDECALRVRNSDYIAKRVAEGGYGPETDSMVANDLHRFIYEYDDADPFKSGWFMHRLERALAQPAAQSQAEARLLEALRDLCDADANPTDDPSADSLRWAAYIAEARAAVASATDSQRKEGE